MPLPLSADALNAITQALQQGNKIEAIKLYRDFTGLGLKDSKDAVEQLESSLRAKNPDQFVPPPKAKGCLVVLLLFALAAAAIGYFYFRK
jgi:hypothetical protein